MRNGGLDERLAQVQLANQELIVSGRSWRSIRHESAGGILMRAVGPKSPGLPGLLGRATAV